MALRFKIEQSGQGQDLNASVGPLVPMTFAPPSYAGVGDVSRGYALIDTGAGGTGVDEELAEALGAVEVGRSETHGFNGIAERRIVRLTLLLPVLDSDGSSKFFGFPAECTAIPGLTKAFSDRNETPVIGVLGRNFLQFCRLTIDGATGDIQLLIDESIAKGRPQA